MEEEVDKLVIKEPDFILQPLKDESTFYNLTFMKKVKKRDTGKFEIEPGKTAYGISLSGALKRIIHHRTAKKFKEENITLKDYLKELNKTYLEIKELCRDTLVVS